MPSIRRWSVVVVGVVVLAALPWAIGHRPVGASPVDATALLRLVQGSTSQPYSGYVESAGGLAIPVTDQVSAVADLLGGRTQLRVWWRGAKDWRVDAVNTFGENDVHRDQSGTWTWNYERLRATRTTIGADLAVRLPDSADLLPPELGRRLLSEAEPGEVSRLATKRIAGVDAVGLRVRPAQSQSSINRVDVWADPRTGLPLRVDVYGGAKSNVAVTTQFLDFSRANPSEASVGFTPPVQSRVRTDDDFDVLSATDAFAGITPPASVAGIARATRTTAYGSVGVYGRGVTELVATPLRGRFADSLRDQLVQAPGVVVDGRRTELGVGPLNLLLLTSDRGGAWLLTGTVTAQTLRTAADDVADIVVSRR